MPLRVVRALDQIPELCASIARHGRIRPDDVRRLDEFSPRRLGLTIGEAEAVFALACAGYPACAEWNDYFADAMGHWFVETFSPDQTPIEAASRLIDWLGGAQARLDAARMRMLARVLETAPGCPEELLAFARQCLLRAMTRDPGEEVAAGVA